MPNPDPKPLSARPKPSDRPEALEGLLQDLASKVVTWATTVLEQFRDQQVRQDQLTAAIEVLATSQAALKHQCDHLLSDLQNLRGSQGQMNDSLAQLAHHEQVQSFNLEQIRLLGEGSARKVDELANDFIQRQVRDPLLKEQLRIYSIVCGLARNPMPDKTEPLWMIAEEIVRFLDSQGLEVIEPKQGDPFIPQRHQPVTSRPTSDRDLHGKISATLSPGLQRADRVVLMPKVEVFCFSPDSPDSTSTTPEPI